MEIPKHTDNVTKLLLTAATIYTVWHYAKETQLFENLSNLGLMGPTIGLVGLITCGAGIIFLTGRTFRD